MRPAANKRLRQAVDAFVARFQGYGYSREEIAQALIEKAEEYRGGRLLRGRGVASD